MYPIRWKKRGKGEEHERGRMGDGGWVLSHIALMSSGRKWDTVAMHTQTHKQTWKEGKLITYFKKTNPPVLLHHLNKRVKEGSEGGEKERKATAECKDKRG